MPKIKRIRRYMHTINVGLFFKYKTLIIWKSFDILDTFDSHEYLGILSFSHTFCYK